MEGHGTQFTVKRLVGLGIAFALVLAFMAYLIVEKPPHGGVAPPNRSEWLDYLPAAIGSVLLVVLVDVAALVAVVRYRRRLPEEEKDWHGPDPHLDRTVTADAYSPSPVMRAAIRRTMAKHGVASHVEAH